VQTEVESGGASAEEHRASGQQPQYRAPRKPRGSKIGPAHPDDARDREYNKNDYGYRYSAGGSESTKEAGNGPGGNQ
jgi:hypothetical protein